MIRMLSELSVSPIEFEAESIALAVPRLFYGKYSAVNEYIRGFVNELTAP